MITEVSNLPITAHCERNSLWDICQNEQVIRDKLPCQGATWLSAASYLFPSKGLMWGILKIMSKCIMITYRINSLAPGGFDYSLKLVNSYDKS